MILRDVLNAAQLAEINAELDGPLEATRSGSAKENVDYQAFHGYRTKRLTNTIRGVASHVKTSSAIRSRSAT